MATIRFVLPRKATLERIKATKVDPLKVETRARNRVSYIPSFDLGDGSEKAREVALYYGPLLSRLDDYELLCELGYWGDKFGKAFVVPENKPLGVFLFEHKTLARKMREGIVPKSLTYERKKAVRRACVALRWQLVPWAEFKGKIPAMPETDSPRTDHRDLFLGKVSNWKLAQALASRVGSCELAPHEFKFVSISWRQAWETGPGKFEFQSKGHRDWAENLYRSILDRDYCICHEQILAFKCMTGCLHRVPLWKAPEAQAVFPELGGGHVELKPSVELQVEAEQSRSQDPKQADLLDVLHAPYVVVGGAEQLGLELADWRPEWDGGGEQLDLL